MVAQAGVAATHIINLLSGDNQNAGTEIHFAVPVSYTSKHCYSTKRDIFNSAKHFLMRGGERFRCMCSKKTLVRAFHPNQEIQLQQG